jgi:hypothetical protein
MSALHSPLPISAISFVINIQSHKTNYNEKDKKRFTGCLQVCLHSLCWDLQFPIFSPQRWLWKDSKNWLPRLPGAIRRRSKIIGSIVILVPGYPRLKEWAYAGLIIDLTAQPTPSCQVAHRPAIGSEWPCPGFGIWFLFLLSQKITGSKNTSSIIKTKNIVMRKLKLQVQVSIDGFVGRTCRRDGLYGMELGPGTEGLRE